MQCEPTHHKGRTWIWQRQRLTKKEHEDIDQYKDSKEKQKRSSLTATPRAAPHRSTVGGQEQPKKLGSQPMPESQRLLWTLIGPGCSAQSTICGKGQNEVTWYQVALPQEGGSAEAGGGRVWRRPSRRAELSLVCRLMQWRSELGENTQMFSVAPRETTRGVKCRTTILWRFYRSGIRNRGRYLPRPLQMHIDSPWWSKQEPALKLRSQFPGWLGHTSLNY